MPNCFPVIPRLTRLDTSYVSEMLYIHSKLMIVDDRRVIVRMPIHYLWSFF